MREETYVRPSFRRRARRLAITASRLLGHANVKNVASDLSMSEARARELVRSVYKKLRLSGRLELVNRWASAVSLPAPLDIPTSIDRRS